MLQDYAQELASALEDERVDVVKKKKVLASKAQGGAVAVVTAARAGTTAAQQDDGADAAKKKKVLTGKAQGGAAAVGAPKKNSQNDERQQLGVLLPR